MTLQKSRLTREKFDNYCFLFLLLLNFAYLLLFYRPIDGIGNGKSFIIFSMIELGASGILFIAKNYSNKWIYSVTTTVIPALCYSLLILNSFPWKSIIAIVSISSILSFIVVSKSISIKNLEKIAVISCALAIFISSISILSYSIIIEHSNSLNEGKMDNGLNKTVISIEDKAVELSKIEAWNELSMDEKLNVMIIVSEVESSNLGLETTPLVRITSLEKNVLASYDHYDDTIYVNANYIDKKDGYDYIETITHECFHAWEYALIEFSDDLESTMIYPYNRIVVYQEELTNYVSGSDNFDNYSNQKVEEDAREYAYIRKILYKQAINRNE